MTIPFPVTFHIFGLDISAHAAFEVLAFFVGYRFFLFLRKDYKDPISSFQRLYILIGAGLGAFIGSRLVGALDEPFQLAQSTNKFLYIYLSKTIAGALLFGTWGVEITKKIMGVKASSGDLFTYPIILGMMIGRIGCFLNGVYEPVFGIETSSIFGMDMGDGLKRHPLALYEIVFLAFLWLSLRYIQKTKTLKDGDLFKLFMISYYLFRIIIEFLKPGYRFPFIHLTAIQITCLLCFIYYGVLSFKAKTTSNATLNHE